MLHNNFRHFIINLCANMENITLSIKLYQSINKKIK